MRPPASPLVGSLGLHAAVAAIVLAGAFAFGTSRSGGGSPELEVWVAHSQTPTKIRDSVRTGQAHPHFGSAVTASHTLTATSRTARGLEIEYPEQARKRGESGLSVLQVEINSLGRVASSSLVQSSGSRDLDRAALESVRNLEGFPPGSRLVKIWFKLQ